METNWRRIIIYLLIFLTIAAIVVAIILSINLSNDGGSTTPTPTPTFIAPPTLTPTGSGGVADSNTCVSKGSVTSSIRCRKDDSAVCPNTSGENAVQNIMVGQEVCSDGNVGKCDFYAACAPAVQEGESCSLNYPGINEPIQNLSTDTFIEGAFIGCDINNQINNCFCTVDSDNTIQSTASIECFGDQRVDGLYNYCGARTFAGGSATPTPTVTPSITDEPTTTPSLTDTGTSTPTVTDSPVVTTTPLPTVPVTSLTSSDETDRIIFAMILIISSLLIFYFDLHSKIGQNLSKLIGLPMFGDLEEKKNQNIKKSKKRFESNITDNS